MTLAARGAKWLAMAHEVAFDHGDVCHVLRSVQHPLVGEHVMKVGEPHALNDVGVFDEVIDVPLQGRPSWRNLDESAPEVGHRGATQRTRGEYPHGAGPLPGRTAGD